MIRDQTISVLLKLLEATKSGAIKWISPEAGEDDWYCASVAGRQICFRFLHLEAANQIGAEPHIMQLHMPGLDASFACGTDGYYLLLEILASAFNSWHDSHSQVGDTAISFLDQVIEDHINQSGN